MTKILTTAKQRLFQPRVSSDSVSNIRAVEETSLRDKDLEFILNNFAYFKSMIRDTICDEHSISSLNIFELLTQLGVKPKLVEEISIDGMNAVLTISIQDPISKQLIKLHFHYAISPFDGEIVPVELLINDSLQQNNARLSFESAQNRLPAVNFFEKHYICTLKAEPKSININKIYAIEQ